MSGKPRREASRVRSDDRPTLTGVEPISRAFGLERGQPVDRHYIEGFLARHAADVRGHVLEIGESTYTRRFGGERVSRSEVLHAAAGNPRATLVADLTAGDAIRSDAFDCVILTQTLQFIYDTRAALRTLHRILVPGGVLLATAAGISQISRRDMDLWGDYWRFTTLSLGKLLAEVFPPENVEIEAHGNVLAAAAFLYGLASHELTAEELNHRDPEYQMLVTVRATRPEPGSLPS